VAPPPKQRKRNERDGEERLGGKDVLPHRVREKNTASPALLRAPPPREACFQAHEGGGRHMQVYPLPSLRTYDPAFELINFVFINFSLERPTIGANLDSPKP
jgi:hypothetical protein